MAALGASSMRKFEEKINRHRQKGIEEEAEFLKIMSECAAVKQIPIVSIPYGILGYLRTVVHVDSKKKGSASIIYDNSLSHFLKNFKK